MRRILELAEKIKTDGLLSTYVGGNTVNLEA